MKALVIPSFLYMALGVRLFAAITWTDVNSDGYLDLVTDDGSGQFEITTWEYTIGWDDYADASWDYPGESGFNYVVQGYSSFWTDFSGIIYNGGHMIDCVFEVLVSELPSLYRIVKFGKSSSLIGSAYNSDIFTTGSSEKTQEVAAAIKSNSGGIWGIEIEFPTPPLNGGAVVVAHPKGDPRTIANIKVLDVKVGIAPTGDVVISVPSSLIGAPENYEFAII